MQASVRDPYEVSVDAAAWVAAADTLCREIARPEPHDPSGLVERVLELADADLVTLVVPVAGGCVSAVAAAGEDARHWLGMTVPVADTLAGSVLRSGQARYLYDARDHLGPNVRPLGDIEALIAIPLHGITSVRAVLTIGRRTGREAFTETDLALATLFAGQVALALNHREQAARLERTVLAGERDRIALGMQTNVITPLFALGLRLQGAASRASGAAAGQLEAGSDDIDEMIKAVRATVYRLAE